MRKHYIFILFIILLIICFSFRKNNNNIDEISSNKSEEYNNIETNTLENENTLKFIATGDALIHKNVYKDAEKNGGYDFTDQIKYIKPIIKKYDLAFYNQETPFAGENFEYSGYPRFNTPSEFGDTMIDAGFNLVSLANNHSFDKGEEGIINTVNYWENKPVMWNGISKNREENSKINIKKKNNISYTLLAYTTFTNGHSTPNKTKINYYSYNKAKNDIDSIKDKTDVIIVSIHWGKEYSHEVNNKQRKIAQELSSLGANIIIGHHPHVLQPIEIIDNTVVMYSLGNFISDQNTSDKLTGALVSLDIKKNTKSNIISIGIPEVELTYTFKGRSYNGYTIVPFNQINQQNLLNSKEIYEDGLKIITKIDKNIIVKPMNDSTNNIFTVVVPHHNIVKQERESFWKDFLYKSNINPLNIKKIIVIGPDHFGSNKYNITYDNSNWTTYDTDILNFFEKPTYFPNNYVLNSKLVKQDHTIVNLIGEIHNNFPNASFVPFLVGEKVKFRDLVYLQRFIEENCSNNCALISSVDFSHFVNLEQINKQDTRTINLLSKKLITETSFNQNNTIEVDCPGALYIMQEYAIKYNLKWDLYNRTNSAKGNPTTINTTSHVFGAFTNE